MADYTQRLKLVREYLEDVSDKRIENQNWDIIDGLFHPVDGHTHNGDDSPLVDEINHVEIWEEINRLRKLIEALQGDYKRLEYFLNQFYEEFQRHNHTGVETIFTDIFDDKSNTRPLASTMVINPQYKTLTLPRDYQRNKRYTWVSYPFELRQDPDPAVIPSTATAKIISTNRGDFTPFMTVGDNLELNSNRRYPNSIAGTLQEVNRTSTTSTSTYTLAGKAKDRRNGTYKIPHRAYHWYGTGHPAISRFSRKFADNREFTPAEYIRTYLKVHPDGTRESIVDNSQMVTTDLPFSEDENKYEEIETGVQARPLYSGDYVLSWDEDLNKFYWFNSARGSFSEIDNNSIQPIYEEDMVEVAACENDEGQVYVLKTYVTSLTNPDGYFRIWHQIVKWGGIEDEFTFEEGERWTSGMFQRKHWKPKVIAPTHLEIDGNNLHIFTQLSWQYRRAIANGEVVNYYTPDNNTQSGDNYQWFPFRKIYGNMHEKRAYVTVIYFNPHILGTIKTLSLTADNGWKPLGTAEIIEGAMQSNNSWSTATSAQMKDFVGVNDKVYLGMEGDEMVFYQAFLEYDGDAILEEDRWNDDVWIENNPDKSWHGIIRYNIATGNIERIQGDTPFRANVAGAMEEGDAYLADGVELVKQWIVEDESQTVGVAAIAKKLIATINNEKPTAQKVLGSFWASRKSAKAKIAVNRDNVYAQTSAIRVNITNGATKSIQVSTSNTSVRVTGNARAIAHRGGVARVGGRQIRKPNKTKRSRNSPRQTRVKKVNNGIIDGARACMLFRFALGDIREDDTVRVHWNAQSRGRYPHGGGVPFEDAEFRGQDIVAHTSSGSWSLLSRGRVENNTDAISIVDVSRQVKEGGLLLLSIRSERKSDKQRKIVSSLDLNYLYITVERQGYVYQYEWTGLPQGSEAAMMIDAKAPGVDWDATSVTNGMEILGVQANVISSQ